MDRLRLPTSLTTGIAHRLPSLRPHNHRPQLRGLRPCPINFLYFSWGKASGLRPPAFGLRASLAGWAPSGRRVKARAATAQRLGLDATGTTQPVRVGAVEGQSPPACPPSLTAVSAGSPEGQRPAGQGRRPRSRGEPMRPPAGGALYAGGGAAPKAWGNPAGVPRKPCQIERYVRTRRRNFQMLINQ